MALIVMIKGIFFDFDGVIVDSETVHNKFILNFFEENGINNNLDVLSSETGISVKNINRYLNYTDSNNNIQL